MSIRREPLEDTWHDVILKSMRGQNLQASTLAHMSNLSEDNIHTLLQGHYEEKTLRALAPALGLHSEKLLHLARVPFQLPVEDIPNNFQILTTFYHDMKVHSYLLWSERNHHALLFDTGGSLSSLLEELQEKQLKLKAIFLTHAHHDHVTKLRELQQQTGLPAWIDQAEIIQGAHALPLDFLYHLDECISIRAFSTPGHSPGGRTYFLDGLSRPIAIVGDALFARSIGGIPAEAYRSGLQIISQRILTLPLTTILAPGHGPITTVEAEREANPFFS